MNRDDTGISVYPPLPVPGRRREPDHVPQVGDRRPIVIVAVAVAAITSGVAAWFLRPVVAPDARIAVAAKRAIDADAAASAQKTRADALEKSLDAAARAKRDAEAKLAVAETAQSELAGKRDAEAGQRKATEAVQAKLKAAVDKAADGVAVEGAELHVRFSDRLLFKPSDDALTDRGKVVLSRLAVALKQLPDQQVWVHGHSDDPPIAAKPVVVAKKAKPAAPPPPRFPTSWELSAARSLAVVHYLQDVSKLDPARLAAVAFAPSAAAKDRSANHRLEIVIAARRPAAK